MRLVLAGWEGTEGIHNKVQRTGGSTARLHTILNRKDTLFYLLLTNGTPFHISSLDNFRRQIEFCRGDRTTWKLTLQDINMTPIGPNTDPERSLDVLTAIKCICYPFLAFLPTEMTDFPARPCPYTLQIVKSLALLYTWSLEKVPLSGGASTYRPL